MSWLWWIDPNADFDPDDEPRRGRYDDDEPDDSSVSDWGPSQHTFDEGPY